MGGEMRCLKSDAAGSVRTLLLNDILCATDEQSRFPYYSAKLNCDSVSVSE